MEAIEIFRLVHHIVEIIFSILILFGVYFAIKKFRLAIWKKGWYLIAVGGFIFALIELIELLEFFAFIKESMLFEIILHGTHIIAFPFLAIGIFLLANSAGKIWGKKRKK